MFLWVRLFFVCFMCFIVLFAFVSGCVFGVRFCLFCNGGVVVCCCVVLLSVVCFCSFSVGCGLSLFGW